VLLQLDDADPAEAQRIIDFLGGAISALDGQVERIGECTFLFAPAGVTVSSQ
jgi:cell division inhibitor SepF